MPDTIIPTTAADYPTLVPPEPESESAPDTDRTPSHSWIPAPSYWNAAPTMLLPPAKPEPPVPIPEGVYLIPTDMLPPALLEPLPPMVVEIPPPPLLCAPPVMPDAAENAPICTSSEQLESIAAPPTAPAPPPITNRPPLSLVDFPIEVCAAINAALALHPNQSADILAAHHLDDTQWQIVRHHWDDAIQLAMRTGDATLLHAHDAAFVTHIENERGPITRDDHARIQAASECGTRVETLTALGLPQIALLPIMRVLLARTMIRPRKTHASPARRTHAFV